MADLKRDRVNRVPGLVYLPIDGSRLHRGQHISLTDIKEKPIFPADRDAMDMDEPLDGNAIGDAVFDAMVSGDHDNVLICDAGLPFDTGELVLSKVLTGYGFDPAMQFTVKVSLNGGDFISYTLKRGQSITIDRIADDTPYVVVEELTQSQVDAGYSLETIENASGVVIAAKSTNVVIHNKYERPQFYGSLIIVVNVSGTGYDVNNVFKVTIQFNEPVNYSVNGGEPIADASKIYVARLKDGQAVTLSHIVVGATYNVVAVPLSPQEIESGYEYSSVTGGSGSIVRDATATSIVNYVYYGATGSLIVTALVDNPVEGKLLHIAITFSRVVNYSVNGGSPLQDGSSVYVTTLAHNDSVVLSNIPNGVSYAVTPSITATELTDGYSPDISEGAYPRRGTIMSKNSPEQVVVKFAKTNE